MNAIDIIRAQKPDDGSANFAAGWDAACDALAALPAREEGEWEGGQHELLGFLAIHADRYQRDYGLNGLHPIHYDLMEKYGARMEGFQRATNIPLLADKSQPEAKS